MQEQAIFTEALEKQDAAERAVFLDRACGNDSSLRQRIERLLERHERAGDFLETPAMGDVPLAQDDQENIESISLDFLTPCDAPGVLGRLGHYQILEIIGRGGLGFVL